MAVHRAISFTQFSMAASLLNRFEHYVQTPLSFKIYVEVHVSLSLMHMVLSELALWLAGQPVQNPMDDRISVSVHAAKSLTQVVLSLLDLK